MDTEQAHVIAQAFDPNRLNADFYENPYDIYAALRTFEPMHRCPDGS
ncbi:MAG: cytochrome P450, partial [Gammaproteobacteria bacterium]